jgi:hypothetical protein
MDQLCFSISCCHRGPNTLFWISGSLTPIPTAPGAVMNGVAWPNLYAQMSSVRAIRLRKMPHKKAMSSLTDDQIKAVAHYLKSLK